MALVAGAVVAGCMATTAGGDATGGADASIAAASAGDRNPAGNRALPAASGTLGTLDTPAASSGRSPLTVCIAESGAPLAWRRSGDHGKRDANADGDADARADGFDVRVARLVAAALGQPLAIRWFEAEADRDTSLALDVDALLSTGLCDVAAGYPLYAPSLGRPAAKVARTPDHDGAPPRRDRPWIELGTLVPSRAYHASPLTVMLGPGAPDRAIRSLDDLRGLRVGTNVGTLADTLLRLHADGRLRPALVSLSSRDDLMAALEAGRFDAVLIELHRYDRHRAEHAGTATRPSGYLHPLAFDLGFVALDSRRPLLDRIDEALAQALADGRIAAAAGAVGMTYAPPSGRGVREGITLRTLRGG